MSEPTASPGTAPDPGGVSLDSEQDQISRSQRLCGGISLVIGKPAYVGSILFFVWLWAITNMLLPLLGRVAFDWNDAIKGPTLTERGAQGQDRDG